MTVEHDLLDARLDSDEVEADAGSEAVATEKHHQRKAQEEKPIAWRISRENQYKRGRRQTSGNWDEQTDEISTTTR
jgi:hypothetical protein